MKLTFRPFSNADLPEILDLWVASWSEVYADIDFNQRSSWFTDHIAGWITDGGVCRIATETTSGEMTGFILINPQTSLLDQICVGTTWKGRGVAEALMEEARRLSPHEIHLDVNAMNRRALGFYQREGFVKTGEGVNPRSGLPIFHYRWQP